MSMCMCVNNAVFGKSKSQFSDEFNCLLTPATFLMNMEHTICVVSKLMDMESMFSRCQPSNLATDNNLGISCLHQKKTNHKLMLTSYRTAHHQHSDTFKYNFRYMLVHSVQ